MVGLIALGLGFLRLDPWNRFPALALFFGSDPVFGVALLASGVLLLATGGRRRRLRWPARTAAAFGAATFGTLGIAIFPISPASTWTDMIIMLALLGEAGCYE